MNRDEVIVSYLLQAHECLGNAETVMQSSNVSEEAWPQVGRLLSEIANQIKMIELTVSGFVS